MRISPVLNRIRISLFPLSLRDIISHYVHKTTPTQFMLLPKVLKGLSSLSFSRFISAMYRILLIFIVPRKFVTADKLKRYGASPYSIDDSDMWKQRVDCIGGSHLIKDSDNVDTWIEDFEEMIQLNKKTAHRLSLKVCFTNQSLESITYDGKRYMSRDTDANVMTWLKLEANKRLSEYVFLYVHLVPHIIMENIELVAEELISENKLSSDSTIYRAIQTVSEGNNFITGLSTPSVFSYKGDIPTIFGYNDDIFLMMKHEFYRKIMISGFTLDINEITLEKDVINAYILDLVNVVKGLKIKDDEFQTVMHRLNGYDPLIYTHENMLKGIDNNVLNLSHGEMFVMKMWILNITHSIIHNTIDLWRNSKQYGWTTESKYSIKLTLENLDKVERGEIDVNQIITYGQFHSEPFGLGRNEVFLSNLPYYFPNTIKPSWDHIKQIAPRSKCTETWMNKHIGESVNW